MTSPKIRMATAQDINEYYGPISQSMRAIAAEKDGRILGVAGVAYYPGQMLAFSKLSDEMKDYPVTIMKAAVKLKEILNKHGKNVFAVAADYEINSQEFLSRIGFEYIKDTSQGKVYRWNNG